MEVSMNLQNQVIAAIRSRKQLKINYEGEGQRIICPHILYLSATGNNLVDAYQIYGYSSRPEEVPGWRPFDISKISELMILDNIFEIAPGYNPFNAKKYRTIIARI